AEAPGLQGIFARRLARRVRFARRPPGHRQVGDRSLSATPPDRAVQPTLVSIQALRGLAAVSVVVYHAFQWLDDPFWIGAAGVDVFFVISGYIIWTVGTGAEASPGRFFWRRLTRVAPAYWLMTGLVIAIAAFWPWLMPQISLS